MKYVEDFSRGENNKSQSPFAGTSEHSKMGLTRLPLWPLPLKEKLYYGTECASTISILVH